MKEDDDHFISWALFPPSVLDYVINFSACVYYIVLVAARPRVYKSSGRLGSSVRSLHTQFVCRRRRRSMDGGPTTKNPWPRELLPWLN